MKKKPTKEIIIKALLKHRTVPKAAQSLSIDKRELRRMMTRHGIHVPYGKSPLSRMPIIEENEMGNKKSWLERRNIATYAVIIVTLVMVGSALIMFLVLCIIEGAPLVYEDIINSVGSVKQENWETVKVEFQRTVDRRRFEDCMVGCLSVGEFLECEDYCKPYSSPAKEVILVEGLDCNETCVECDDIGSPLITKYCAFCNKTGYVDCKRYRDAQTKEECEVKEVCDDYEKYFTDMSGCCRVAEDWKMVCKIGCEGELGVGWNCLNYEQKLICGDKIYDLTEQTPRKDECEEWYVCREKCYERDCYTDSCFKVRKECLDNCDYNIETVEKCWEGWNERKGI